MADESLDEKARRKAEVRARMEQAASQKKKKGFMTHERKKRLKQVLRKKAAEELKLQQELKAQARLKNIKERTGQPKNHATANEAEVIAIIKEYYERLHNLEGDKYDLEYSTSKKEFEIKEIQSKVNYQRGRFKPPPLKKVSRMAQQMAKIALFTAKASQSHYVQSGLKAVKREDRKEEETLQPTS